MDSIVNRLAVRLFAVQRVGRVVALHVTPDEFEEALVIARDALGPVDGEHVEFFGVPLRVRERVGA